MNKPSLSQLLALAGIALAICAPVAQAQAVGAAASEMPPTLSATTLLPPQIVKGANYAVNDEVVNDGLMNHYVITSSFGKFDAHSDAEVVKRIHEIGVIAKLKEIQASDEFGKGIGDAAGNIAEGAKSLVTSPLKTIGGVFEGAGTILRRGSDSLLGDPQSKYEDDRVKSVWGVSQSKRELAGPLAIDPYSSNEVLQDNLNRVARASAGGYLLTNVTLGAVGGGVGTAFSVTGGSQTLNDMLTRTPPTDIRRQNREKLQTIGFNVDLVDLFLANTWYSPTYQLLLVEALHGMNGVAGREALLKVAIGADSDALCMLRQRQARMYAGFHQKAQPLDRLVASGNLIIARTRDGKVVIAIPVDHVAWTESIAQAVAGAEPQLQALAGTSGRELWLGGTISPLARQEMEARGWKIFEKAAERLIGPG